MTKPWTRHPCFAVVLAAILLPTLYMLIPASTYTVDIAKHRFQMKDLSLASRIEQAHWIYGPIPEKRAGLIEKFGPTPRDIQLFPNRPPWPAYTVWSFFPAAFNCPHETRRLGNLGQGGTGWVCGLSRVEKKPDCTVYSFGIHAGSSYERDLLSSTDHCAVYAYDFSVSSFGPEITANISDRTHFKPYTLPGAHGLQDNPTTYTLEELLDRNGHKHVDILKLDIEGREFDALTKMIKPYIASEKPLPFGQLQVDIHLWNVSFEEFLRWFEMLEEAGLRPFKMELDLVAQNYNSYDHKTSQASFSFLNVKGDNVFIKDTSPRRQG
ncbi:methyltransferase domain-containing protein [Panaeolus papilionaceus]|nr:methyltransferase domain-containing protein [Panaeolus papilionaceus]